jgi:hypothetical protein
MAIHAQPKAPWADWLVPGLGRWGCIGPSAIALSNTSEKDHKQVRSVFIDLPQIEPLKISLIKPYTSYLLSPCAVNILAQRKGPRGEDGRLTFFDASCYL